MLTKEMAKKNFRREAKMQKANREYAKATTAYLKALDKFTEAKKQYLLTA